jgi:hypothetical protein
MKPFHRIGSVIEPAGLTPEKRGGDRVNRGVVSVDVTVDEAYAAARLTAIHTLGMIRDAVASLDNVVSQSRALRDRMRRPPPGPSGATNLLPGAPARRHSASNLDSASRKIADPFMQV